MVLILTLSLSLSFCNSTVFFNHSSSSYWRCINIDYSSFSLIIRILRCILISNCSFFSISRFSRLSSLAFSSLLGFLIGVNYFLLDFDHDITSSNITSSIHKSIVSSRTTSILCSSPVNRSNAPDMPSFSSHCKQSFIYSVQDSVFSSFFLNSSEVIVIIYAFFTFLQQ